MWANRKELSMTPTPMAVRRSLFAVFAVTAAGGTTVAALSVPSAPSVTTWIRIRRPTRR